MLNVDLARWQFAFTSINHFFFVPVTIGLAFLTALLQTAWHHSGRDEYLRLTRFFGTLLVINVAIGVVTGLVQEFQFGMNWSAYSRLVGNIFGAPLAMEGLGAFFLESTFLGLWLFGWDKLPRRVHLLTIWAVAVGTVLSAAFIMAANSWMQHPVGYVMVHGTAAADRHLGAADQPGVRLGVRQGAVGVAGDRRGGDAGGVGVAAAARRRRRGVHPVGTSGAGRAGPGDPVRDAGRATSWG